MPVPKIIQQFSFNNDNIMLHGEIQFNHVEDCYFAGGVADIFLISHNLMVWSLPFDMK